MAWSAGMLVLMRPMSVILRDRRRASRPLYGANLGRRTACAGRPARRRVRFHSVVDGDDDVTAAPPARREGGEVFRAGNLLVGGPAAPDPSGAVSLFGAAAVVP